MLDREMVYVSCGLTGLSQDHITAVKGVIDEIESRGHQMLRWTVVKSDWTDPQIYRHDKHCAKNCTAMLVICDERSTGMGMEFAFAIDRQTPVLCVARHRALITPMVRGACEVEPNIKMAWYDSVDQIPDLFDAFLAKVREIEMPLFAGVMVA